MKPLLLLSLASACALTPAITSAQTPTPFEYTLTFLGANTVATSINRNGHVAGIRTVYNTPDRHENHIFVYANGKLTDLGTGRPEFGYIDPPRLNNLNQLAVLKGSYFKEYGGIVVPGGAIFPPYFLFNGQRLIALPPGSWRAAEGLYVAAFNDQGEVLDLRDEHERHYLCLGSGQLINLNNILVASGIRIPKGGNFLGLNNAGQIIGSFEVPLPNEEYKSYGFLISNGRAQILPFVPISINDHGQIVGSYDTGQKIGPYNIEHACLYSAGQLIDLGTLPGFPQSGARSINNCGEILGVSEIQVSAQVLKEQFWVYKDGQMHPISVLGHPNINGAGGMISDNGQIIGGPYLLTPKH